MHKSNLNYIIKFYDEGIDEINSILKTFYTSYAYNFKIACKKIFEHEYYANQDKNFKKEIDNAFIEFKYKDIDYNIIINFDIELEDIKERYRALLFYDEDIIDKLLNTNQDIMLRKLH